MWTTGSGKTSAEYQRRKGYHARYRATHKAQKKAWTLANADRQRTNIVAWKQINKTKHSAQRRRYSIENKEVSRAYRLAHPELTREINRRCRARRRGLPILNPKLIVAWERRWRALETARCYWCLNQFLPTACHVDHIVPVAKGGQHAIENLCVSCSECNWHKHDKLPAEWNQFLRHPALLF